MYLFNPNRGQIRVFYKLTGQPSNEHPSITFQGDKGAGFVKSTDANHRSNIFIDDTHLYLLNARRGQIRVYDKLTGIPSSKHPSKNFQGDLESGYIVSTYDQTDLFIDNVYLYILNYQQNQVKVYNKYTGQPSSVHPSIKFGGESGAGYIKSMDNRHSQFYVETGDTNTNYNYYNIFICGYGISNSIKRIQSIISVEKTTKTIKNISWREVF